MTPRRRAEPDLLAGVDAQAEFDALVSNWHVDTINAVRAAERDLTREDADWRMRLQLPAAASDAEDGDHYVPPPPPPLPRLAGATVLALVVVAASVMMMAFRTDSRPARRSGLPGRSRRHSGRRGSADHAASRWLRRR